MPFPQSAVISNTLLSVSEINDLYFNIRSLWKFILKQNDENCLKTVMNSVQSKVSALKQSLSWNSDMLLEQNAHQIETGKRALALPPRYGNAPVSTWIPFQSSDFALYCLFIITEAKITIVIVIFMQNKSWLCFTQVFVRFIS